MSPLRVLDLFSGIGGFSLGLERTGGFQTVAFCEIDPFCRRVLKKHWPEVPAYDDVRTLTAGQLSADGIAVDVICGGFPCQDISVAGKGAGIEGERSGLWSEYARIIGELRPRYVIVENVSALLGRGLGRVLGDLAALGFDAEWHCIPASAVGAPHRRDRLWMVAYSGDDVHAGGLGWRPACGEASRGEGSHRREGETPHGEWVRAQPSAGRPALGYANGARLAQREAHQDRPPLNGSSPVERAGDRVPDAHIFAPIGAAISRREHREWLPEPDVGRVANGVPARVDRLKSLGNAVVPQIPELIGRALLDAIAAQPARAA